MKSSIKITVLLGVVGVLFGCLCKQVIDLARIEVHIDEARKTKYFSVLFAEELRFSSSELSRFACHHIATANPQCKARFQKVLDVREGRLPRESESETSLLAVFKQESLHMEVFRKPLPYLEIARLAGFSANEFSRLKAAKESSDELAKLASKAIDLAEQDPGNHHEQWRAISMLTGKEYFTINERMMAEIRHFQRVVAERASINISHQEGLARQVRHNLVILGILLAVSTLAGLLTEHLLASRFKAISHRDPLTNLASRRFLHEYLENATAKAEAHGEIVLLGFVDLNGFKPINDRFGHRVGDELLKTVATSLRDHCRSGDLVARYGGDEFVVVFVSAMMHRKESIERMRLLIENAFRKVTKAVPEMRVGASAGISIFPHPARNVSDLIKTADEAMYHAKKHDDSVSIAIYERQSGTTRHRHGKHHAATRRIEAV